MAFHPRNCAPLAGPTAILTGFSGHIYSRPLLPAGAKQEILKNPDYQTIDLDGISVSLTNITDFGRAPMGQEVTRTLSDALYARQIGQVFGAVLDDADQPNLYLAATSAYGVQIVGKDGNLDGVPDRSKRGAPEARFMAGQWGDAAGPRTIWRVDGATGAVQMFADLASDGATTAPSLGNLAYDAAQYPLCTGPSCILVLCLLNPSLCVPPPPDQICAQRAVDVTCDNNGDYLAKIIYTGAPATGAPANFGQIKLTDPAGQITSLPQTQTVAGQFTVPLTGLVAGQVGQINLCSFDAAADGAPYDCCNTTVTFKIPAMNVSQLRCNNDPPYPNLRRDWAGRCDVAERGLGRACPQRARAGEWGF